MKLQSVSVPAPSLRFPLRLILAIARIGAHPDDGDDVRLKKAISLNAILLGGIPVQLTIGAISLYFNEVPAALATLVFAAVSGKNGLVYRTLRECRLAR